MQKIFLCGSLIMPFLLQLLSASPIRAQMSHDSGTVPYKSIAPQVRSTIEQTNIQILKHIVQARSNINSKEFAKARNELVETTRLMNTIRDELSTAKAKNLIRIARSHLTFEKTQKVLLDLTHIDSALDEISAYFPTDKAKEHIGKAKRYLEKNSMQEADKELLQADRSLIVIEVELPLLKARQYVIKAKEYLAAGNARKADEALQVAEQRARALSIIGNSPLLQTKQNTWLAFRNYLLSEKADTGPYLENARKNLDLAMASGSAAVKNEAGSLSQEIAELEKKSAGEEKIALSAFKTVWEKSEALAERSVAYISAGLSESETTLKGESDLIEAMLHVKYAETYQVTTAEPDKAARELDTAYSYLQKAAGSNLAGAKERENIRWIGKILLDLKANPKMNDVAVQERYDKAKEKLRYLIRKM